MSVAAVVLDRSGFIGIKRVIQDQTASQLVWNLSSRQQYRDAPDMCDSDSDVSKQGVQPDRFKFYNTAEFVPVAKSDLRRLVVLGHSQSHHLLQWNIHAGIGCLQGDGGDGGHSDDTRAVNQIKLDANLFGRLFRRLGRCQRPSG